MPSNHHSVSFGIEIIMKINYLWQPYWILGQQPYWICQYGHLGKFYVKFEFRCEMPDVRNLQKQPLFMIQWLFLAKLYKI